MTPRNQAHRLAEERAALAHVAGLVARGLPEEKIFAAVIEEVAGIVEADSTSLFRFESEDTLRLLAAWSRHDVSFPIGERRPLNEQMVQVRDTGQSLRYDAIPDAGPFVEEARQQGIHSGIGVPISVDGRAWGIAFASSERRDPFPLDAEARILGFTELVGTAIATTQTRASFQRLAEEQAALRRVAELVAGGAPRSDVLDAVVREACGLTETQYTALGRYTDEGSSILVATHNAPPQVRPGDVQPRGGPCLFQEIRETGRALRVDDYEGRPARERERARELGVTAGAAAPIFVEGRLWGALSALTLGGSIPEGIVDRLAQFAELAGTAISNAQARHELRVAATEQAALRRVAELVARGVAQETLFASVAGEASKLIEDEATTLLRFDEDGCATVLASCAGPAPVGTRFPVDLAHDSTPARVLRTGQPARTAHAPGLGAGSSVGAPIVVEDRVWGMLEATTPDRALPVEAEQRLQQFAELVAAALANAQARAELQRLADEQTALRRVAELVARAGSSDDVLQAVVTEASRLLGDAGMSLLRFDTDGNAVVVATHRRTTPIGLVVRSQGTPWAAENLRTRRALRIESFDVTPAKDLAREHGVTASVVAPIIVEGRVWGMLSTMLPGRPSPPGTEERLAQFAELAGTAVANAESRAELTASRARVLAAADESRRRLQRDVHDGAQQRLVQTVINLKLARRALDDGDPRLAAFVDESLQHAERATSDLRDLVRGILPAALSRGGLRVGLTALCADVPLPVDVHVSVPRLPAAIETTAYFVVAEALSNVVKHARATSASVTATADDERLDLEIRDDGVGGADPRRGTGLMGLSDRVEAGEGTLVVESPAGGGTTVKATLRVTMATAEGP